MLKNGDVFPSLTFARVGGGEIHLPADLAGGFGAVLFHDQRQISGEVDEWRSRF